MLLSVWLLCGMLAARGGAVYTGEDEGLVDTIRMYTNTSISMNFLYSYGECMPERSNYKLKPHQQVIIEVISPANNFIIEFSCKWRNETYYNFTEELIIDNWHLLTINLTDIGEKSGDLMCTEAWDGTFPVDCHVRINIAGDDDDEYVQYYRSFAFTQLYLTPVWTTNELHVAENSSLTLSCIYSNWSDEDYKYVTIHRYYANGSIPELISHYAGNKSHVILHSVIYFQKEIYNDNIFIFELSRTMMNESLRMELRLRYREEWIITDDSVSILQPLLLIMCLPMLCMIVVTGNYYFWRLRGKQIKSDGERSGSNSHIYEDVSFAPLRENSCLAADSASAAHSREPRSTTPDSNQYDPVYDVVYEDRLRIERLYKQWLQSNRTSAPPTPPPIETIPLQELPPLPSRASYLQTPNSSITPVCLYLLNTDSNGYKIPKKIKLKPTPIRIDSDETLRKNKLQMESQRIRETPSIKTIPIEDNKLTPYAQTIHQLPPDSAIPPEDLYLLKIDSDGYEIPDEVKFITLRRGSDENI